MRLKRQAICFGLLLALGMAAPAAPAPAPGWAALQAMTVRPALRRGAVAAGGLSWQCTGSRCTTTPVAAQDLPAQCRALAHEVGAIGTFAQGVSRLTVKQIDLCNESAHVSITPAPAPEPPPPATTFDPNARITVDADGTVRVQTTHRLMMTGLGDRPIAPPPGPVPVRPRDALTMTGLGDRPIAPPPPAVPVRVPSILTMTGTHGPAAPTDTVTVRVLDFLMMTGVGDRPIAPPPPPVPVRPADALTMTGLGDRPIAPPPAEPEVRVGPAQVPPLRMIGVYGR